MNDKSAKFMLFVLAFSLMTAGTRAASIVDGQLGAWLRQEAAPQLAEMLNRHPRLQGLPIRISELHDGQPIPATNRLMEQIKEQLTHDLLSTSSARIVFADPGRAVPIRVSNVLGIEVERHAGRAWRISLAIVDVDEGMWINGSSLVWRGALTGNQRRAFHSRIHDAGPPVHPNASVKVAAKYAAPVLLSEIELAQRRAKCASDDPDCVDVVFELYEPAYMLLFYTLERDAAPVSCAPPSRARDGWQRYGLNVPEADFSSRPALGFYVLAVRGRETAEVIHRALANNSAGCGVRAMTSDQWVASLGDVLERHGGQTDWRAIHLSRQGDRISVFEGEGS